MAFNLQGVSAVIGLVIESVNLAERFIKGSGKGKDKREAAISDVLDKLQKEANRPAPPGVNPGDFDWISLILASNEAIEKVGVIVDAVVGMFNFIGKFQGVAKQPEGKDGPTIN